MGHISSGKVSASFADDEPDSPRPDPFASAFAAGGGDDDEDDRRL